MIKLIKNIIVVSSVAILVSSCATPHVVNVKKTSDKTLSCQSIQEQIKKANKFEKDARDERKLTGTNVAAAVFFLPGLAATYFNTEEAIDAASDRRDHLNKLFEDKKCN